MTSKQYSTIPSISTEKELRSKFPWIGKRPLMLPSGWLGIVHNICQEIEAVLAPDDAKKIVQYFFATVRHSRLRIFIELSDSLDGEARADAIDSLLQEVQINCAMVCHICGKEAIEPKQFNQRKEALPNCGAHDNDRVDEDIKNKELDNEVSSNLEKVVSSKEIMNQAVVNPQVDIDLESITENDCSNKVDSVELMNKSDTAKLFANIQIYDVLAIQNLLPSLATRYRDKEDVSKTKEILNKLVKSGGQRTLMPFPEQAATYLDQLKVDFPNFSQVIDMLRGIHALSSSGEVPRIPPILLLGEPGMGKTMFAEALATFMQVSFRVVRMENLQVGAGLVGSSDFWSNSKSGAIFDVLTNGDCGNPLLVVDEVDKAVTDNRFSSPINGLYSLLEPASAKSFHDESLPDVSLDASRITWVLTANYKQSIPEPILSRVQIFDIPKPDLYQSMRVATNIYMKLLNESPSIKARFMTKLSDEVTDLLASLSPRKMRFAIEMALGRAALAGRNLLLVEDIEVNVTDKKRIGFL